MNELVSIEISDPNDPDARHCLSQYYKELAELFTSGFDPSVSSTMEPDEMCLPHGMLLVARTEVVSIILRKFFLPQSEEFTYET
jgi:hypothetical protein